MFNTAILSLWQTASQSLWRLVASDLGRCESACDVLPKDKIAVYWYNIFIMLQQDNRLRKVRDFNLILKHGRWVNGRFLDIKVLELAKNQDFFPKKEDVESFKKQLKLAISTGLKVHKSAVKRNRVRRQIREVLRLLLKDNRLKTGFYILVVAKKDILNKNYTEISEEIKLLLSRAKVI